MAFSDTNAIDILENYGIGPSESEDLDLPGIGEIEEGETVYSTSISQVLGLESGEEPLWPVSLSYDDARLSEWMEQLDAIVRGYNIDGNSPNSHVRQKENQVPLEPHCAWYCPLHFFGHGWGIYIRERCILSYTLDIATFINWSTVNLSKWEIARQLLRSAFYVFFLHEQFHHKVESLGFRLLISTANDRYRPYKANVYRRNYLTRHCLEESLANAESIRRLSEERYIRRIDPSIRSGLRHFLKHIIPLQPPGYAQGIDYISENQYRNGLFNLQSQVLDGTFPPITPAYHWSVAPNIITALADIIENIYVILPQGARPIFPPTWVSPGASVSSRNLEGALTRYYGYQYVQGGKGSHVKLAKPGAPTITLPGNKPVLSPGVLKQVFEALGGYPLSKLPEFLDGRLGRY